MSDTPTPASPAEKTVVASNCSLCRLWTCTIASLTLNALILAGLLACAIIHHHMQNKHHGFGGHKGWGGGRDGQCEMGGGQGFHHGGGMGPGHEWDKQDGDDHHEGMGARGRDAEDDEQGPKDKGPGGPGMGGGFGMHGMMGGMGHGMGGTPDPAKISDMMINHLSEKLTLTEDEKAKIKPIIDAQVIQMQKDMEAQHAAMLKSMEDTRTKIKALLTADQQKALDAMPLPGQKPADTPKPGDKPAK